LAVRAERVPAVELVRFIVSSIVEDVDAVDVYPTEGRHGPTLAIRVAEGDRGVVVGRQGRTIKSIEHIVRLAWGAQTPALDVASG
jgi:predicted RNA-binding protein YlqC (UPF0109 family)